MTIACLKGLGKMPFLMDKLTSLVNEGRRMSIHCKIQCMYPIKNYFLAGSDLQKFIYPKTEERIISSLMNIRDIYKGL